jgi:PAS domain S-box-containing protein
MEDKSMNVFNKGNVEDQSINSEKTEAEITYLIEQLNGKLAESERQFRLGVEESPIPIVIHAEDGGILAISKTWTEITGYTIEEIPTIQVWAEKSYNGKKNEIQEFKEALYCMKGSQHAGVFPIKTKSGDIRLWDFHTTNISNVSDERNIVMSFALDITEKNILEIESVRGKNLINTTLSSIIDGVISCDENGKIILMNSVAEELTGWSHEDVIDRKIEDVFNVVDEFSREKRESIIKKVIESKKINEIEENTILISKDGIETPIEDCAAPILNGNGDIEGVVLIFRDYSAKKQKLDQIKYLSYHDQLTGIYNRKFYE